MKKEREKLLNERKLMTELALKLAEEVNFIRCLIELHTKKLFRYLFLKLCLFISSIFSQLVRIAYCFKYKLKLYGYNWTYVYFFNNVIPPWYRTIWFQHSPVIHCLRYL